MLKTLKTKLAALVAVSTCHRSMYGLLAGCHVFAGVTTGHPSIYWPMAFAYAVLAMRG
ncbi:MAG: hypothetical protein WAT78_08060 [Rhizobiaceae bacterium]